MRNSSRPPVDKSPLKPARRTTRSKSVSMVKFMDQVHQQPHEPHPLKQKCRAEVPQRRTIRSKSMLVGRAEKRLRID